MIQDDEGVLINGAIVGIKNDKPFRALFEIRRDTQWRVREVSVDLLEADDRQIRLKADGKGHWTNALGEAV